jgi:hypothetical protein
LAVKAKLESYGALDKFLSLPAKDDKAGKILAVFNNKDDARRFTNELNSVDGAETDADRGSLSIVEGKSLYFFRKPSRFSREAMTNKSALFIRNLNFQVEEWELEELFGKYGEIRSIIL